MIIEGNCFHFRCFVCNYCNKNIGKKNYKYDSREKLYYHAECFDELNNPYCEYCCLQIKMEEVQVCDGKSMHSYCCDKWKELAYPIEEFLNGIITYENFGF